MPRLHRVLTSGAALFWAASLCASAASGVHYAVDKIWRTANGLPQSAVIAMTQTRDGYLWLGTLNGLVRFDGIGRVSGTGKIQFPVFNQSNTPELESGIIVKLFEDSQGNLWVGTETAGVVLVSKDGKVTGVDIGRGSRQGKLKAVCEDTNGAVWLYTADGQLCRYQNKRVDVWNAENDPAHPGDCHALVYDEAGLLWVGTDFSLVALGPIPQAPATGLPLAQTVAVNKLDVLINAKGGGQWRLGNRRIQRWRANRLEKDWPYPFMMPPGTACEDAEGNLFVGTYGDGVYCFDSDGNATRVTGLSHATILCLCVDREGCLWVGTDGGGLDRVKRQVQVFHVLEGTVDKTVQSVCDDGHGGLWIGYNWERIDHWTNGILEEPVRVLPVSAQGRPNKEIGFKNVFVDRNQRAWAGASGALDPRLFQLRDGRFIPAEGAGALNHNVSAIFQDRQGTLWVGTEGGLARLGESGWKLQTVRDGLSSDLVQAIADDAEHNLWVGTQRGGINRIRNGKIDVIRKDGVKGPPSDDVTSLLVDAEGVLWAGTPAGLARFQDGRWTRYSQEQGLLTDNVGYLLEDGQDYLWMGSYAGLMRVRKSELNAVALGLTNSVYCRAFGEADGLPDYECTYGSQPAACRTPDGRLWFPTTMGLAYVDPKDLKRNTNPPPVAIEAVLVDGRPQHREALRARLPESVTLPASSERLEIDYTSLNLAAPERARFRYRMQGYEKDWTDARNERVAHYHRPSPGHYHFEVTACNEDGVWSEHPVSMTIVVLPPFWQTWWFLSAFATLLLASVIGIVHYLSTQKLQRQLAGLRQKEALEKERARIARDLHDQLGANLTQVALLGELAEADKDSPPEVEAHARQISQTARETTHALDEIVWTVNPSNDTVEGLVNYICKYAQDYLALAGLRYRLEVPPTLPATPISPEVRHNVFLAAKEAVNNVVKHAAATSAWLRLQLDPNQFILEIEDNGRGLGAKEGRSDRNGLRNMRKRMADIDGEFIIGPGGEGGTRVRLIVPIKGTPNKAPPEDGKRL